MDSNTLKIFPDISNLNNPEYLANLKKGIKSDIELKKMQLERLHLDKNDSDMYKKQELDIQIEIKSLKNQMKWLNIQLKSLKMDRAF